MNMGCNTSNLSTDATDTDGLHYPLEILFSGSAKSKQEEEVVVQLESKSAVSSSFKLVEQSVDLLRDVGSMLDPKAALDLHRYVQKEQSKEIYNKHEAKYLSLVSQFEKTAAKSATAKERDLALKTLREKSSQLLQHPELKAADNDVLVRELKSLLASLPIHE